MKKILVTGAGGFIGSHLTEMLYKDGYNVKAFVKYNSNNRWGWLENLDISNAIEIVAGDIRDYDFVHNSLKECSAVFHLAALIGIPYSYVSPRAYIETNIIGTLNILQAAKELNIEQVLITSTSETYGTAQYTPIDEKHPLVGQSPYSASKIGADQLALSYFRSFNLPVKIVRPFNTYGPRQSARAIIPTIITQILTKKEKIKLGNLKPIRDLTFVHDTCKGFISILKSDKVFGEVSNIGMGTGISIKDLIKIISELIGISPEIMTDSKRVRPKNSEVEKLICDNSKILQKTDWHPEYTMETGLEKTIEWIKENIVKFKPNLYNI